MTHSTRRPQCRLTPYGEAILSFPYSAPLVSALKDRIPHQFRSYDTAWKEWRVWAGFQDLAICLLLQHFPDADVSGSTRTEPGLRGRVRETDPFGVLHLRETAPVELIEGACRILARLHHPDAGGTDDAMQAINGAYAALRERVRT
jgi:hypothetical protein